MFYLLIAINTLIGFFFAVMGSPSQEAVPLPVSDPREPEDTVRLKQPAGIYDDGSAQGNGVLVACAVLGGLLTGGLVGDMFHRVDFLHFGSGTALSFVCFWALLATGLASWAVGFLGRLTLGHIKVAFVLGTVVYFSVWQWAIPIRRGLLGDQVGPSQSQLMLLVGVTVFPTLLLISLLLPHACIRLHNNRRHLGVVYGLHMLALAMGFVGFTWFAPGVNVFYSLKLVLVFLVLGTVVLFFLKEGKALREWCLYVAALLFVLFSTWVPQEFDPDLANVRSAAAKYPVRSMTSNGLQTTFIVDQPGGDALYVNNRPAWTTDGRSRQYSRLMAHFPLLAQQHPTTALLVSFGVGHTAAAIACHDTIEHLHIVEANEGGRSCCKRIR